MRLTIKLGWPLFARTRSYSFRVGFVGPAWYVKAEDADFIPRLCIKTMLTNK